MTHRTVKLYWSMPIQWIKVIRMISSPKWSAMGSSRSNVIRYILLLIFQRTLNEGVSFNQLILAIAAENWRFHRKHLNPCFTPNIINTFYPIFNKGMAVLVEKLKRHVGKGPFNIAADIRSCAMDLICGKWKYKLHKYTVWMINSENRICIDRNYARIENQHTIRE